MVNASTALLTSSTARVNAAVVAMPITDERVMAVAGDKTQKLFYSVRSFRHTVGNGA